MDDRHGSPDLPTTIKQLRAWLRDTTQGQGILAKATEKFLEARCRECQDIRPYPKVLVVMRRLGNHAGAEVYAEEGISLRFMELPDVPDDAEFGRLAEELIELKLPRNWRHMVQLPSKRIQSEVFRGVSVAEAEYYRWLEGAIREVRE